jgi:predicted nuclease of predicted toxin-antitoxin system
MRFLANENFPGDAVAALRAAGHDAAWVRTDAPGSADTAVLARAQQEGRILLTFDKDFGELAWRSRLPARSGIILFRLPMPPPARVGETLARILASRADWVGHFAVVEPGRVRLRPLPATSHA